MESFCDTVDGQIPARPRMMIIPFLIRFEPSQVVSRISEPSTVVLWLHL